MKGVLWVAGLLLVLLGVTVFYQAGMEIKRLISVHGNQVLRVWALDTWRYPDGFTEAGKAYLQLLASIPLLLLGHRMTAISGRIE